METLSDISALFSRFSYAGIFLSLILGSVGFPFPEDAILMCSGLLIARGVLSPAPALATVFAGMVISDLIIFSLGRQYGRRIVIHKWFGRIISAERLASIEGRFNAHGIWVILIGRQLIGIRSQMILMSGIMRVPVLRFLAADAPAVLVTMGIMITAGHAGGKVCNGISGIKETMLIALIVLFAGVCIFFLLMRLRAMFRSSVGD
ncbi:MAG: DedA family protein [Nitrospiraceae bacterium]|nr:DedA family protein [Nitrospiraceae bacterium]